MKSTNHITKKILSFTLVCILIMGMSGSVGTKVYADTTVYVTKTGSKYHKGKCGNGTYYPSTLSEAQARGLTPCEKCFGANYNLDAGSNNDSDMSTNNEPDTGSNVSSDNNLKKSIKISNKSITLIVGQSRTLKVKGTKSKVKWQSNKRTVARVTSKGKVTAKKKGTATITAKVEKKKLACKVKVENPKLSAASLTMNVDEEAEIYLKGCSHEVKWSSGNTDVAEVEDGYIYAYSPGRTVIRAKVHGKTYKCTLIVEDDSEDMDEDDDSEDVDDDWYME